MEYRGKQIKVNRSSLGHGQRHFFEGGSSLFDRVALALCERQFFPKKELFESYLFAKRAQRLLKSLPCTEPWVIQDIASGHGLTGLFLAAHCSSRRLAEVWCVDPCVPKRADEVMEVFAQIAPAAAARVRRIQAPLGAWIIRVQAEPELAKRNYVWTGCHACGELSDATLEMAISRTEPFALMPCCPYRRWKGAWPKGFVRFPRADFSEMPDLGAAVDMARAGRAQSAGYRVRVRHIDAEITPHNRVILGVPNEVEYDD
ncbi:MAG: hypothetical protein AAGJ35_15550 [Myxococcota bacterium]